MRENGTSTITPKSSSVVDIENEQNAEPLQEPTYLEAYMKFMYWTCVSPFYPTRSMTYHDRSSKSGWFLNIFQKVSKIIKQNSFQYPQCHYSFKIILPERIS